MNARKSLRIELRFESRHSFPIQVFLRARMQSEVITGRFHPVDLLHAQKEDPPSSANNQPIYIRLASLPFFKNRTQPGVEIARSATFVFSSSPGQGFGEPAAIERLQQVIQCANIERADSILIERSDEDNDGPSTIQTFENRKPIHRWHLGVQKDQIGLECANVLDGAYSIAAFTGNLNVGFIP